MLIIFFIGICIGSFINVVIDRYMIHKDFIFSRSECDHCHHILSLYDLIPIFSYILLKGRCRYCHCKITIRNFFVEILCGLVFLYCFLHGLFVEFIYIILLLIISFIDIKYMIIPDSLLLITFLISLIDISYIYDQIIGSLVISVLLIIINCLKKDSFGGGDIKMFFVWGWILGYKKILEVFYCSVMLTSLYCLFNRFKNRYIAFGPFISLAIIYVLLK